MPVVGHERESEKFNGVFLKSFVQDAYERFIVRGLLEDCFPIIAPVECVVDDPRFVGTFLTRHRIVGPVR